MKEILYAIREALEDVTQASGDIKGVKIMAPIFIERHILECCQNDIALMSLITIDTSTRAIEIMGHRINWGYEKDVVIYNVMWPVLGIEPHRIPVAHFNDSIEQITKRF